MSLNDMTVTQLRKIATNFDVPGRSAMRKAELVSAIEAAEIAAESVELFKRAETVNRMNEVAILRHAPGRAIVTAAFDGQSVGGSIFRIGNRLRLVAGNLVLTAYTYEAVAKRFAKALGFHADRIDVQRMF